MSRWMSDIKVIIWDFDGVIILSDEVREKGFKTIFRNYPPALTDQLLHFHRLNGGLSRYVKIKHFYENILGETISQVSIQTLADEFSSVMLQELTNRALLNPEWLDIMTDISAKYEHHIASGSDGKELNFLCKSLGIDQFFSSIAGSPTPKIELVRNIISQADYENKHFVLVGDAYNDFEAAAHNQIRFIGYRNITLSKYPDYLTDLSLLKTII